MKKLKHGAYGVALSVALAGCAEMDSFVKDNSQAIGAVTGAVAGGLLVNKLGGKGWQTALGALAGAYVGVQLSKYLSEQDQAQVQQNTATTLSNARDGETVTWQSEETGAKATMTPTNSRKEKRDVKMLRDKRVVIAPKLDLMGDTYASKKDGVRLRSGPSTSTEIVGSLKANDPFTAVGKVQGEPWIMVAKNNITIGYVYAGLVGEYKQPDAQQTAGLREEINLDAIDLDAVNKEANETIDLDNIEVVGDTVVVETDCRTMNLDIESDGGKESTSFDACKGVDGAWEKV